MVARFLSGYSIRGLINYNESKVSKGDASVILANQFAIDIENLDIRHKIARFEKLTRLNQMAKRNAIHIMLNFDRTDKPGTEKMIGVATAYMNGIGFGDQPFLVYQHHDVNHPHLHIVTTNIRGNGSRIDFHNIGKSISESIRKKIELEFGLLPAQGRGVHLEDKIVPAKIKSANYGNKPTKQSIYNVVAPVLRSYAFTSLAEFNAVLQQFNVVADRGKIDSEMYQKRGLVYSILNESGNRVGVPIKASLLAGCPTLDQLEKKFLTNALKRKPHKEILIGRINQVLKNEHSASKQFFVDELRNKGIDTIFRQNDSGQIYGVTYVDHTTRYVFNGSDLGKTFSAKALLNRFTQMEAERISGPSLANDLRQAASGNFERKHINSTNTQSTGEGNALEILLEKPALDDAIITPKRKKKKKHKRSQSFSVKN